MNPKLILLVLGMIGVVPIGAARAEQPLAIAPAPHVPAPPVSVVAVKGGYQITLNRATAEMFRDTLATTDEKDIAATLRKMAKDKKDANPDDKSAGTLELVAFVVSSQMPGFKKSLSENMGPGGAVITMTGFQSQTIKVPKSMPRLEQALATVRMVMPLLPEEAKDALDAMRAVGRTTPLFWKVEPRE